MYVTSNNLFTPCPSSTLGTKNKFFTSISKWKIFTSLCFLM